MDTNTPANQRRLKIPAILRWSIVPSCLVAGIWALDFISNKLPHEGPQGLIAILSVISFPIAFLLFLVLAWTPILGISLAVCLIFRPLRSSCGWSAWIVFAALLLPFYYCFHNLLTLPTMAAYRQMFHLHQVYPSTIHLSESQVISKAKQVASEHGNNIDDYKPPTVLFAQDLGTHEGEWGVSFYPKAPFDANKPETTRMIFVRVYDGTGKIEYHEGNLR